ncbi:MAG: roadblock/LC7 domain-containing protein [Promethearchaeota archaeon]
MNDIGSRKDQKLKILTQILKKIKIEGKLKGVLLSFREGSIISENLTEECPQFNADEFSSMCASALESIIGLGKTIGGKTFNKAVVELEHYTIIIIVCDEKTFLSLILNENSKINNLFTNIEDYIRKLRLLY